MTAWYTTSSGGFIYATRLLADAVNFARHYTLDGVNTFCGSAVNFLDSNVVDVKTTCSVCGNALTTYANNDLDATTAEV